MGHDLSSLGTASLDSYGGLITQASPQDLPEGASPRCWDVDFLVGSVYTRPGLHSVYTYSSTLAISAVTIYNGLGTFTYTGKNPTVNEDFSLEGFGGQLLFLNGQTIFVISVNLVENTFTAEVDTSGGIAFGTFTGLTATASSLTGNFLGPNVPSIATDAPVAGAASWVNVDGILGNVTYASVSSGTTTVADNIPSTVTQSGVPAWTTISSITSSFPGTKVTLTAGHGLTSFSGTITASNLGLNIPTSASIEGVAVDFTTGGVGTTHTGGSFPQIISIGDIVVQLVSNGFSIGGPITATSSHAPVSGEPFSLGGSNNTWGSTLSPAIVNSSTFGLTVQANLHNYLLTSVTQDFQVSLLKVTLYYTLGNTDQLWCQSFTFSVPSSSGVTGIGATFQAYTTTDTEITLQLIKNGQLVGVPKTQTLTPAQTVYSLGISGDLWGTTLTYADVNNPNFGVAITASGEGTTSVNDLDMLVYITPGLSNFNYVKSYIQNNESIFTLALDASGLLWQEDVTNNPGVLSIALSGIIPGSFAKSATEDDQEYVMFSNLTVGTDRPRVVSTNNVTGALQFLPLSQTGPGAPPAFQASVGSGTNVLVVTAYSVSGGVVNFTFIAQGSFVPVVGSLYIVTGTGNVNLDGFTFSVLGTPAPNTTSFHATTTAVGSASGLTAKATPTYSYSITSITQPAAVSFNGQELVWSVGVGSTAPGSNITFYYGTTGGVENPDILSAFSSGNSCIVYVTGAPVGNGTWLVTGHGTGKAPHESGAPLPYFTITYTSSAYERYGGPGGTGPNGPGNTGTFQISLATLTVSTPIPNLSTGDSIQISGATPSGWNGSWTVQNSLTSGILNITSSQMSATGVATYGYTVQSGIAPVNGEIVTVSELTNAAILNTTGVVSGVTGSTFQIDGFSTSTAIPQAAESGQAFTFGTQFTFDPGTNDVGTSTPSPIFGNDAGTGTIAVVGGSIQPIGAGTRQGVVFWITDSGYESTMSPPVIFTTSQDANFILATQIPIGPPNVKGRGIAFTEAGQNGVPGANFYVIPEPVVITVGNTTTTYSATVINDNITTSAQFTFTDAVLLNAEEVDIQGNDLFNLIELGSSAWCIPYAGRMFYGLQLNKIDNWTSGGGLTFDSGYLPTVNQPLGWTIANPTDQTLVSSPVTGQALYIKSTYSVITPQVGLIYQTAYQDPYQVAIIQPNNTYSVRLAASCPSGITVGNLVVDLTDYNKGIGFGRTYGSFSVPLTSMTSITSVFSGTLLTLPFTTGVSSALQIRVYVQNMGAGADCLVDRIEVFPTQAPYLLAQVYGSYVDNLEAIDASGTGGIIDTTTENPQPCLGGFVMHDELYLLKTNSLYATQDNPNSEPGGWSLREVSNKVGTCGISAYDTGEEWAVTACRQGIFGFNGGQPVKIMQELWNLWEQIYWPSGNTIWLRNDIVNKRIFCAVPLPTGFNPNTGAPTGTTLWLPDAPYNPTPSTPNVILMLNYQGMATFDELISSPELHI